MTGKPIEFTRRHFSQVLAAFAASTFLEHRAFASPLQEPNGFAYVACGAGGGAIHAFRIVGSHWQQVQSIPSSSPAQVVPHPTLPVLYVVHKVDLWDNLPRGAITSYTIDDQGCLAPLNTQPLSLSATNPSCAALLSERRSILVSSEQAGIFNMLRLRDDGSLTPAYAIRKGLQSAFPAHILARPDGTVLAAEPGQGTIGTFTPANDSIDLNHRQPAHPDSRPRRLAHHPSSDRFYCLDTESGSITVHAIGCAHTAGLLQRYRPSRPGPGTMAAHPEGRFLLASSGDTLAVLAVDGKSRLAPHAIHNLPGPLELLEILPGGSSVLATQSTGRILQIPFNSRSGACGSSKAVAFVAAPSSLIFRSA